MTGDPRLDGLCRHGASPCVAVGMYLKAMTVQANGGGVEAPLKKTSNVLYRGSPPSDPKPLRIRTDQRREISPWRRNREVMSSLRQYVPVLEPFCLHNLSCFLSPTDFVVHSLRP